jgi:CheY-like chemotaxis protein
MIEILYVEDVPGCQRAMSMWLRSAGYGVRVASNGLSALEAMAAWHPDLILLDMSMPDMDGLTFLGHLRAADTLKSIPVIVFTASTDTSHRERALELGAREYLIKSRVSLSELRQVIESHLISQRPDLSADVTERAMG